MRECGVCKFGRACGLRDAPAASAACVLLFACPRLHGKDGALAKVEAMAEEHQVSMASAYCKACRATTWLARDDLDLNEACVDFWQKWRSSSSTLTAMQIMRERNGEKRHK